MDNEKWLLNQLDEIYGKQTSFSDRAILAAARQLVQEQAKRIELTQGELDGRAWSPLKW